MNIKKDIHNVIRKREAWSLIFSLPNTIWFNLRYLSFSQAIKLPIWVHYSCRYKAYRGGIVLSDKINTAMIRYGFSVDYAKNYNDNTYFYIRKGAVCKFEGNAHIGRGSKIIVQKNAVLEIGDDFSISASSTIKCYKHIVIGKGVLFAWDCLLMDSDGHQIYGIDNKLINHDKEIAIGNNVWLGCGVTILKGVTIPNDCVVGAKTTITRGTFESNTIIVGNPPKSKKDIKNWVI